MKRVGYLYEKMLNKKLIKSVILKGAIGKKKRGDVIKVLDDVDGYTDKIFELLETRSYKPTKPKIKVIHDQSSGKEREISIVPYFPDGIMHQLATEVMRPVLMRGIDFVGYRFYHGYTLLRRRNFLKLTRQCRKVKKILLDIPFKVAAGLISRVGQLKHCSGLWIRQKYFDSICYRITKKLKDVVREYARNHKQNNIPSMVCGI